MDTSLWRRTFIRGTQPNGKPVPDIDSVADEAFVKANFKDKFGIWLTQGNNKLIGSLDGLLSTFFSMRFGKPSPQQSNRSRGLSQL